MAVKCPCKWYKENGHPCFYVRAVIIQEGLHPMDPNWSHIRYHAGARTKMYDKTRVDFSLLGKLKFVCEAIPHNFQRTSGQPKKKKDRSQLRESNWRYKCKACGKMDGHQGRTCPKPNTEYRHLKNTIKAMEWAKQQVDIHPEDYKSDGKSDSE